MAADYWPGGGKPPALLIPGLTRNAADFEALAPKIAAGGRDAIAVSLRGRGRSDRDPDYLNYRPEIYAADLLAALDQLKIEKAVFIGTSLGGIVTMLAHEAAPHRIAGAVLNDIGPALAPEGLQRIAAYVGEPPSPPAKSLEEAAARMKAINAAAFPDASDEDWLAFARRTHRPRGDGGWDLDYDPNIGRALVETGPAPDLWPAFESLKSKPTLVIRGAISDLLTPEIISDMRKAHPNFQYAEVPRIGHAPMMTEPAAWRALNKFLDGSE